LPRAVRARAWCRVDLAGGTLDIWPLGLLHRGARTLNVAIDLPVAVSLRPLPSGYVVRSGGEVFAAKRVAELLAHPETALVGRVLEHLALSGVAVDCTSDSPRGAGLGASSALTVALLAAGERWIGRPASSPEALAATARDLEARLMGLPTGLQDHYPAILGGALEIRHDAGGTRVRALPVDLEALGNSMLVFYTGQSHFSAANNWQILRRRLDGDGGVTRALESVARVAERMAEALATGDLRAVGKLMAEEWAARRELAPGISTPEIEAIIGRATSAGAWGAKTCGAGGGGSVAILCPPEQREAIRQALIAQRAEELVCSPSPLPLEVGES